MMESPFYNKSCFLCERRDRVYAISYRSGTYSAKDDIIQFMGPDVESMLDDNDVLCNNCMNIFDNIANFKRKTFAIICKKAESKKDQVDSKFEIKSIKFNKIYSSFLSNINLSIPPECKNQSPSPDLLVQRYSIPTIELPDNDLIMAEKKYNHYLDKEVQDILRPATKRRKRRKRGKRKLLTHRKNSNPSKFDWGIFYSRKRSDTKCQSEYSARSTSMSYDRSYSENSRLINGISPAPSSTSYDQCFSETSCPVSSIHSAFSNNSRSQSRLSTYTELSNCLRNHEECLMSKKTRSVSRVQDTYANILAFVESSTYTCTEPSCQFNFFSTLEDLTEHKKNFHKCMALYWCTECNLSYTSDEDLRKHKSAFHNYLLTNCPCCSETQTNVEELQAHLKEHLIHSVPCIYCDKIFLSRKKCDRHVNEMHKGKRKRIRLKRPQSILDRVVKDNVYSDNEELNNTPNSRCKYDDFRVRIQGNNSENECRSPEVIDLDEIF